MAQRATAPAERTRERGEKRSVAKSVDLTTWKWLDLVEKESKDNAKAMRGSSEGFVRERIMGGAMRKIAKPLFAPSSWQNLAHGRCRP